MIKLKHLHKKGWEVSVSWTSRATLISRINYVDSGPITSISSISKVGKVSVRRGPTEVDFYKIDFIRIDKNGLKI